MRVCSFCGERNEDWMEICQRCGNSIVNADSIENEEEKKSDNVTDNKVNNTYIVNYNVEEKEPPKKKKEKVERAPVANLDLIIILMVLLIILICLIVYTIFAVLA